MKKDNTRIKILDAMYTLVAQKGYDKASLGQIADMIGIKKASIYYYFHSKEELFIELVQKLYKEDYNKKMEDIRKNITISDYKEAVLTLGKEFIASYFENQMLRKVYAEIDIQTARIPALKQFVQDANGLLKDFLVQLLSYGMEIEAFPKDFNVEKNAQMLYTILIGIDDAILYDLPIEPEVVLETLLSYLFPKELSL